MKFPKTLQKKQVIHVLRDILLAGKTHKLIVIDYASQIESSIINKLRSFVYGDEIIYLQEIFRKYRCSENPNLFANHVNYKSQIRYFAQDKRIYRMTTDSLKNILDQICSHYPEIYRQRISPLTIEDANIFNLQKTNKERSITFELHTDIWFPWVRGFGEEKIATTVETLYDNRQLALPHTRRLNQFLLEMQQLVHQYNATWEVEKSEIPEIYRKMVNQTGIELLPDFHLDL